MKPCGYLYAPGGFKIGIVLGWIFIGMSGKKSSVTKILKDIGTFGWIWYHIIALFLAGM